MATQTYPPEARGSALTTVVVLVAVAIVVALFYFYTR